MKPIRLVLLATLILFAGCIGQEAAPAAQNQTLPQENAGPGETAPATPEVTGNITAPSSVTAPAEGTTLPPENPSENGTEENGSGIQNPEPQPAIAPAGLSFGNGSYIIALDDASVIPASSEPCGIFSLWSSNGSLIEKMFICPGESEIWRSPDDSSYRIFVVQVAAPYSGSGAWAKVIVFG
jgi:hypothetical protein